MNSSEHSNEHESAIKTPRQLLVTVILAFLIPIVVIILLVNLVGSAIRTGAGSSSQTEESITQRIQPVAGFKIVDANAPKVFKTGEQVFESTCSACHGSGVMGAPKFGDKDSWAPFIKQGYDDLVKNAIHGIGNMPPKGGNASLDDYEVARAVVYMANHSGADFDEPEAPADEGKADNAKGEAAAKAGSKQAAGADKSDAQQSGQAEKAAEQPKADQSAAEQSSGNQADTQKSAADQSESAEKSSSGDNAGKEEAKSDEGGSAGKDAAKSDEGGDVAANAAGEKLYKSVCFACHATGAAGAPKFGSKEDWAPFIKTGLDEMLKNAISGVGAMPPRGGSQATDEELKAAIEYMVDATK